MENNGFREVGAKEPVRGQVQLKARLVSNQIESLPEGREGLVRIRILRVPEHIS